MAVLLLVACAADACGSAMQPRNKGNKKRPLRPPRGRKGELGRYDADASSPKLQAIRTRPSAVPPRIRRDVAAPARLFPRRARRIHALNQGIAITGFPGLIYSPASEGFLQSLFSLGDLPRTGAGGTFSRVRYLTRSRSLCGAVCAYSSQRSGQHRPTVADTIANGICACQAIFWNTVAERFT